MRASGGARRPRRTSLLAAHVLGRDRAGVRMADQSGLPGRAVALARVARRDLPRRSDRGWNDGNRRSCSTTTPTRSMRRLGDAARQVHRPDRPAVALDAATRSAASSSRTRSSTATTSRSRPTGSPARRGHSPSARSGTSRRSHAPAGSTRRGSLREDAQATQITSASTRRRSGRPARPRELPAGVHAPGAHQRRALPGPRARGQPARTGAGSAAAELRLHVAAG